MAEVYKWSWWDLWYHISESSENDGMWIVFLLLVCFCRAEILLQSGSNFEYIAFLSSQTDATAG